MARAIMSEGEQDPRARAATRVTPYELAFGGGGFEEQRFGAIEAEAARLGIDALRFDQFALLHSVAQVLREIVAPDDPPEMWEQHRAILFHCFNFWRFGRRLFFMESAVARYLVEAAPGLTGWELNAPRSALYLQLPARLFWASIAPDTPPEPVDGFFLTLNDGDDPLGQPFRHLHGLMVLGIRRNRAGFSVIPFETETGAGIAAEWAEVPGRDEGKDFETTLPGGEMAGMYSILTTLEVLKLVARGLWYIDANADHVVWEEAMERRTTLRAEMVRYSRFDFHRIRLDGPGGSAAE
jgi:hypothetical protein